MINQKDLKEALHYNPDTGVFTWVNLSPYARSAKIGDVAGYLDKKDGYMRIKVKGKQYLSHRLAWFYAHGVWPKHEVDHVNHDRADNRIVNLREVTRLENMRNASQYKTNTSGVTGVYWHKPTEKWQASIAVEGKLLYLGLDVDKFEAICARKSAENRYNFHSNHGC